MIPFADNFYVRGSGHRINVPSKRRRWCYSVGVNPRYPCDVSSFCCAVPVPSRAVFTPVAARDFYVAAAVDQAFCIFHHGKSALSRIDTIEAHDYATPDTRTYSKNEARVLQIGCPLSGVKRCNARRNAIYCWLFNQLYKRCFPRKRMGKRWGSTATSVHRPYARRARRKN